MRRALIVVLVSFTSGCGLIFQGTTRNVRVSTQPEGAAIKLGDKEAVSPAGVTLSRRFRNDVIYRATKDGYRPACRVIDCRPPPWINVFDSIPAAIPLLIDLAAGALGNCADATLVLVLLLGFPPARNRKAFSRGLPPSRHSCTSVHA